MGQRLSSPRSVFRPSPPKPAKKRAGSRTTKPLMLNLVAAAAISEDSLPFAEPKSPRGAARGGTSTPFGVNQAEGSLRSQVGAKKQEKQAKSGPGTNRSGHDSQHSSHEASKNAGTTNRQNKRSTSGTTPPQAPVIPPFQSAKEEAKHKAKAERHAKSGSGTNRSGHDSQSSSRNPTPSNSPESKSAKLGTGKNAGVSSDQNKNSVSDTTSPTTSPETPTNSPWRAAGKLLGSLKRGPGTNRSEHDSQPSSRNPTPSNSPESKPIGLGMGKNAERQNKPSTSDTTNPAPSAESISSPDKQPPSGNIKASTQEKSTELGAGKNAESSGGQFNLQRDQLNPFRRTPEIHRVAQRRVPVGAYQRIASKRVYRARKGKECSNRPSRRPTNGARRRVLKIRVKAILPISERERTQGVLVANSTSNTTNSNPSAEAQESFSAPIEKGANPNLDPREISEGKETAQPQPST
ncbi:hypothetical protein M407DRAFT_32125 [Tulasnella calospora MUT 4182]|uniref:Uncharacterized protein n=1 Tax=Tulasnella calospora MUT 4182 TaxID=1051891 RepID=A0A0C3PTU4_9AGAM|nr:hypothetical protein M407DRAFT_32125 [Tulasnella calospora MUT 4182]